MIVSPHIFRAVSALITRTRCSSSLLTISEEKSRQPVRMSPAEGLKSISQKGIDIVVICIVFNTLAATAVGLRVWARRLKEVSLSMNDFFILLAMVG